MNQFNRLVFIQLTEAFDKKSHWQQLEELRNTGNKIASALNAHKYDAIQLSTFVNTKNGELLAIAEGCALSNYQFLRYKSNKKEKNTLTNILLSHTYVKQEEANVRNNLPHKPRKWDLHFRPACVFLQRIVQLSTLRWLLPIQQPLNYLPYAPHN